MRAHETPRLQAVEAQQRAESIGLVSLHKLREAPTYTNETATESERAAEYAAFLARCHAEADAWNAEARRWHAQRFNLAAELFRVEAQAALRMRQQRLHGGGDGGSSFFGHQRGLPRLTDALSAVDMLSADAGLTASSMLADLAEDQMEVDNSVSEFRERIKALDWQVRLAQAAASVSELVAGAAAATKSGRK